MAITVNFNERINLTTNAQISDRMIGIDSQNASSPKWRRVLGIPITKTGFEQITSLTFNFTASSGYFNDYGKEQYNWFIGLADYINPDENTAEKVLEQLENTNLKKYFLQKTNNSFSFSVTLDNIYWSAEGTKYLYIGNDLPLNSDQIGRFNIDGVTVSDIKTLSTPFYTRTNILGIAEYNHNTSAMGNYKNYDTEYMGWQYDAGYQWNCHNQVIKFFIPALHGPIEQIILEISLKGKQQSYYSHRTCRYRWALVSSLDNISKYDQGGLVEEENQIAIGAQGHDNGGGIPTGTEGLQKIEINSFNKEIEGNKIYYLILYPYLSKSQKPSSQYGELLELHGASRHNITLKGKFTLTHTLNYQTGNFPTTLTLSSKTWYETYDSISLASYLGESFTLPLSILKAEPNGTKFAQIVYNNDNGIQEIKTLPHGFTDLDKAIDFNLQYKIKDYTVNYILNSNGGSSEVNHLNPPTTFNVVNGITFTSPTRIGYNFTGWQYNDSILTGVNEEPLTPFTSSTDMLTQLSNRVANDINVKALWEAIEYPYDIIYKSKTNGKLISESTILFNPYDEDVTVNPKEIVNYQTPVSKYEKWGTEGTITFEYQPITRFIHYYDGNTYLRSEQYNIESFDENSGKYTLQQISQNGFEFIGWTKNSDDTPFTEITIPEEELTDLVLYASWKPTNRNYTVYHYFQNFAENDYTLVREDILSGQVTTEMKYNKIEEKGFSLNENKNEYSDNLNEINVDGTAYCKLYYSRQQCTLTFDSSEYTGGTYYYQQPNVKISLGKPNTGYGYQNLPKEYFTTPDENGDTYFIVPAQNSLTISEEQTTPTLIEYKLIVNFNNGFYKVGDTVIKDFIGVEQYYDDNGIIQNYENPKRTEIEKDTYTYTYNVKDIISLPVLQGPKLIVEPTFLGWLDGKDLVESYEISGQTGDKIYIAQFSYSLDGATIYGSGKSIYVKNTEKWVLGTLMPNKEEKEE